MALTLSALLLLSGVSYAGEAKRGGILDQLDDYRPYQVPYFNPRYRAVTLPKDKDMADKCQDFIKDDGTYGELGELVKKEMIGQGQSEARPVVFFDHDPQDIEKVCRGFKKFDPDTRLNFWIYVMAAIATNESGCDPAAKNEKAGPNGTGVAVGLFQTPALEEGKKPDWRGRGCQTPPNYETPESQVACGMEIMSDLLDGNLCSEKKSEYTPFDDKSYWATLRPNNKEQGDKLTKKTDTLSIIKGFPPCQNPS